VATGRSFTQLATTPSRSWPSCGGYTDLASLTPTQRAAYAAPFASTADRRGAVAFPQQILDGSRSIEPADPRAVQLLRAKPAMCIFGAHDRALPARPFTAMFRAAYPEAPLHVLEDGGHFAPDERSRAVLAALDDFLRHPVATPLLDVPSVLGSEACPLVLDGGESLRARRPA